MAEYYAANRSKGLHSGTQKMFVECGALSHRCKLLRDRSGIPGRRATAQGRTHSCPLPWHPLERSSQVRVQPDGLWVVHKEGDPLLLIRFVRAALHAAKQGQTRLEKKKVQVLVAQLYPTLCDSCSPPGFSLHEILQAKILEWVAIPFQGIFRTQGSNPGHLPMTGRLFTV